MNRRSFLGAAAAASILRGQSLPEGLPDPLVDAGGKRIRNASDWPRRRAEIITLFTREMYGQNPGRPPALTFHETERATPALNGLALRKQVTVSFSNDASARPMELLFYLPRAARKPVPAILGMNFLGNWTVSADPGIRLSTHWVESNAGVVAHRATNAARGTKSSQWPIEKLLRAGFAFATMHRIDIDPDRKDGYADSVRALFPALHEQPDNFSAIGAWAWAFSRALDYLETERAIDAKRVAIFGWSRLGKAALWAGATDPRIALVISNESGAGGAKLFRRGIGESIRRLNEVFPHWFCENFRQYNDRDTALPFDQHMVIASIAPRPVYIGSAQDDAEADPEGEFWSGKAADPVYRLLGTEGLPADHWPAVNQPVAGQIGYHVRSGKHDVTTFDWAQYLPFVQRHLGS